PQVRFRERGPWEIPGAPTRPPGRAASVTRGSSTDEKRRAVTPVPRHAQRMPETGACDKPGGVPQIERHANAANASNAAIAATAAPGGMRRADRRCWADGADVGGGACDRGGGCR